MPKKEVHIEDGADGENENPHHAEGKKKKLADHSGDGIKVCVRVRPFSQREAQESHGTDLAFDVQAPGTIVLRQEEHWEDHAVPPGGGEDAAAERKAFGYDHIFTSDPQMPCYGCQRDVFEIVGMPLLDNTLNSYNGCLFAYGQTGSGKSHSVLGDPQSAENKGILPRACEQLFKLLDGEKTKSPGFTWNVLATYLEIYNEKLSDLLIPKGAHDLQVRLHPTHGPHVPGLTETPVSGYDEVNELLNFGAKNRIIAATNMNAQSSRSHAVFTVDVRMSRSGKDSQSHIHFVDLAGSERQKKTGATGDRLKEGIAINQSLTALGKVCFSLTSKQKGVVPPFRESKLTLLLKEALSGNSKTVLIACISPSTFNLEETVSTLDFASRCKMIKTQAKKNETDRRDMIQALEAERAAVQDQLEQERKEREKMVLELEMEQMRAEDLQKEMELIKEQLAAISSSSASDQHKLTSEYERAQEQLAEAEGEKSHAIKQLIVEMGEKEALRKEREAALENAAQAEREREQIQADREAARVELEREKAKLAEAEESSRAEIVAAVRRLEAEQCARETLVKEREAALEQVSRAERERAMIQGQREEAQKELELERHRLAESTQASKQEIEAAVMRLEAEVAAKESLNRERNLALQQVSKAEMERAQLSAERERTQQELEAERAKLAEAEDSRREEIAAAVARLEVEQAAKEKLALERKAALEEINRGERERALIEADRERAMRELEEERAKLATAEEAKREEMDAAVRRLEAEVSAKAAIEKERIAAVEEVNRATAERDKIEQERRNAHELLEKEKKKLLEAEEASKEEIMAAVRKLESEQAARERFAQEREAALERLAAEQAEKEHLRKEREAEIAKAELLRLEREKALGEVERVQKENKLKEDELQKERLAKAAAEEQMRKRLQELEQLAKESETKRVNEYEEELKERMRLEKEKEDEMSRKMQDLESRLASWTGEGLDQKAQEQRDQREKALDELGFGVSGLSEDERKACPRLYNLHADASLSRTLVFFLPKSHTEGVLLGSDAEKCQIRIEGLGVGPEMCVLKNEGDKAVYCSPRPGGLVRVNGATMSKNLQQLQDGDRLAIGRAYIFELEIPAQRKSARRYSRVQAEQDFARAVDELEACADLDPRWKNGVNSAMFLVKREFGTREANALLIAAKRASEKIKWANEMLDELPEEWKRDVLFYELAVLFDAHGLPILSVVARRGETANMPGSVVRDGSDTEAVWTIGHFMEEKLPRMQEVYEEYATERDPQVKRAEDWQALVWGDVPISLYRSALERAPVTKALANPEPSDEGTGNFFTNLFSGRRSILPSSQNLGGPKLAPAEQQSSWWGIFTGGADKTATEAKAKVAAAAAKSRLAEKQKRPPATELKRKTVTVPRLFDGKLGVKLKGRLVVSFDNPEAKVFGWHVNDEIVEVNGNPVRDRDAFAKEYLAAKETPPVVFAVLRASRPRPATTDGEPENDNYDRSRRRSSGLGSGMRAVPGGGATSRARDTGAAPARRTSSRARSMRESVARWNAEDDMDGEVVPASPTRASFTMDHE